MSLAKYLWTENRDLAQTTLEHPFVQGLRLGSLPLQNFQSYIAQDAYFLEAFARAYALALAYSPDQHGLHEFFDLLAGVQEELRLHASYAASWDVDLTHVIPAGATLAYTEFLLSTASLRRVGETCAAMTPCMRLYAFLGQSLAANSAQGEHRYTEWIQTYASPDFEALATRLEALLDHYADDVPAIHRAYRRAMSLEFGFFAAQFNKID
ncbi:MAG: TenA family protein [Ktedonobacteraceae bacterium]|nr:TenA family protein [Ktedonobacteraceae bacterium]